jgi:hypothetical protein
MAQEWLSQTLCVDRINCEAGQEAEQRSLGIKLTGRHELKTIKLTRDQNAQRK